MVCLDYDERLQLLPDCTPDYERFHQATSFAQP